MDAWPLLVSGCEGGRQEPRAIYVVIWRNAEIWETPPLGTCLRKVPQVPGQLFPAHTHPDGHAITRLMVLVGIYIAHKVCGDLLARELYRFVGRHRLFNPYHSARKDATTRDGTAKATASCWSQR